MPNRTRQSELGLILGLLAVVGAVPIAQTVLDLARGERVQATDVFRRWPSARNLREFEHTLEERSWFEQQFRPGMQQLLFATLHDTGPKAILGRDQWLFYRPDLRYVLEPDRPDPVALDSRWVQPPDHRTRRESVERTILRFRDQLQERGIALVVVPVPGKPSVYPDRVTRRELGRQAAFVSPTRALLSGLDRGGVSTVDLFDTFREARSAAAPGETDDPLYLAQDTHWTPRGARLAAQAVAARLREMKVATAGATAFVTRSVAVARWGDVLDMMQIPGLRRTFRPETVECQQVLDPVFGPMVPAASDRPGTYRHPGQKASVLVLGDSFCRIYQYPEPQSLGELPEATGHPDQRGSKRLLPGSAGFIAHLALALQSPVDTIVSDGGASTDVRRKLSTHPEILEGKKVVVWEFVERDIALGAPGWEDVPLPAKLD
jgi:hypothetical protein